MITTCNTRLVVMTVMLWIVNLRVIFHSRYSYNGRYCLEKSLESNDQIRLKRAIEEMYNNKSILNRIISLKYFELTNETDYASEVIFRYFFNDIVKVNNLLGYDNNLYDSGNAIIANEPTISEILTHKSKTNFIGCEDILKYRVNKSTSNMDHIGSQISNPTLLKIQILQLNKTSSDHDFQRKLEVVAKELKNLLKTQGWYGIPKLFGFCISSLKENNGINVEDTYKFEIRYLTSRHDDGIRLCSSNYASVDCKHLPVVMASVKSNNKPGIAALTLMLNIAVLFEEMSINGVMQYDFQSTGFFIDSNFDVTLTDTDKLIFLSTNAYSEKSRYQRLLSGTICKKTGDCPSVTWAKEAIMFAYGQHCLEIGGLCTLNNQCWGVDSLTHLCVIAKWIFSRLHFAVPAFWSHEGEVTKLLRCGSKFSPNERCNWTDMRIGFNKLLNYAHRDIDKF